MPPVRDLQVPEKQRLWAEPFSRGGEWVGEGRGALHSEPCRWNQLEPPLGSSCCSLILALCSSISSPLRSPRFLSPRVAPPLPPPARGPIRRATRQAQVIKSGLRTQDTLEGGWGRDAPGTKRGPGPGNPQQSSAHPRPRPVLLQSPPPSLNSPLRRHPRLDREQVPDPDPDPHPS